MVKERKRKKRRITIKQTTRFLILFPFSFKESFSFCIKLTLW